MNDEFWVRLDAVDWTALGNPDVPKWVRNLISDDRTLYTKGGYWPLEDLMGKAPTGAPENYAPITELLKTETSIYLTPFLIELLEDETTARKDFVLQLISHLAIYPNLVKPTEDEIYKVRVQTVFEAVLKGVNTYKMLLTHSDVEVRKMAKETLVEIENSLSI